MHRTECPSASRDEAARARELRSVPKIRCSRHGVSAYRRAELTRRGPSGRRTYFLSTKKGHNKILKTLLNNSSH